MYVFLKKTTILGSIHGWRNEQISKEWHSNWSIIMFLFNDPSHELTREARNGSTLVCCTHVLTYRTLHVPVAEAVVF